MNVIPLPGADGGRLAENVMHFARVLRAAGLPVGTQRVQDALSALRIAGLERREDFYWTLACVFVDRREQRELFDQAFHMFWRDPDLLGKIMQLMLPKVEGMASPEEKDPGNRLKEAFGRNAPKRNAPDLQAEQEIEIDARFTFSSREVLRQMDFESMNSAELAQARALIANMRMPLREVRTRRFRPDAGGNRVDLRASLRAGLSAADVIPLRWKKVRTEPPPLVILCDISGSMTRYARMFLHFIHALSNDRRRVDALVFGTRLTLITREMRQRDVDVALDRVGARVQDWAGGTRIGSCLHLFNRLWSRRLLGRNACVLLLTDGLDRDGGAGLSKEMERLHKSCRQLIWLNPLLRFEGFEPRATGIKAMLPHVDLFVPAHNLDSLADLAELLARPPAPPMRGREDWNTILNAPSKA